MTGPREQKWLSVRSVIGGLALFASEALVVIGFIALALLAATVLLAIL